MSAEHFDFDEEDCDDDLLYECSDVDRDIETELMERQRAAESRRLASDDYLKATMMKFFAGKRAIDGSLLTEVQVCTRENIEIVRELGVSDAIEVLYNSLAENGFAGDDMVFCMRLQNECSRLKILKEYSGGVMIVYLKLVMGYDL